MPLAARRARAGNILRAHGRAHAIGCAGPMTSPDSIPPVPDALAAKLRELAGIDTVAGAAVTVVQIGRAHV